MTHSPYPKIVTDCFSTNSFQNLNSGEQEYSNRLCFQTGSLNTQSRLAIDLCWHPKQCFNSPPSLWPILSESYAHDDLFLQDFCPVSSIKRCDLPFLDEQTYFFPECRLLASACSESGGVLFTWNENVCTSSRLYPGVDNWPSWT